MNTERRITLRAEMHVTIPQALALREMFWYWNHLAAIGSSRYAAFYADGDGNFRPKCVVDCSEALPDLPPNVLARAIVQDKGGDRWYDFDALAWALRDVPEPPR